MNKISSLSESLSAKSEISKKAEDALPAWDKIRSILARELSEQSYKTWIEPVRCLGLSDSSLTLGVPDNYYGQWLRGHYENLILSASEEALGSRPQVAYEVLEPVRAAKPPLDEVARKHVLAEAGESAFNQNYTFENFVIGPQNRFSHAAALAVCQAPAMQYNPFFIYGPVGLGKTHLMQATAHEIKSRNPNFRVLYISSEKFTNQLITAIQTRSTQQFRNKYRTLDLLLIDDIHFIAEKEATQEEFFHTFNTLYDAHKQIVVSSDRPPKDIPGLEERLVSRFSWGLVTDIQPPDFETRVAILRKKMEKETVEVPDEVAYFIAHKIRSNIRELEGALIRVVAYCTLTRRSIDLKLAQEVLRDSLQEEAQKISIAQIQRIVAEYFNLKVGDLRAKKRTQSVVKPRQIAMYLIRSITTHSLPEIGEFFGGRDHTTVLYACNKIGEEIHKNPETQRVVEKIRILLKK